MMSRILALLFLVACIYDLDYNYRGIDGVDPDFNMPNQRKALFLFEQQFLDAYPEAEDREVYKQARVYYVTDTTCRDVDVPSWDHEMRDGSEVCVAGIAYRCEELFVAVHEPEICDSALIHEFTHCLAFQYQELMEYGAGDRYHEGPIWDMVASFNETQVCPRGW